MNRVSRIVVLIMFLGFVMGMGLTLNAADETSATCTGLKCPICGTKIDKEKAQFKSEYKDGIYYFASEKCKAEFDTNPEKYAKGCHFKYAYVCPMKECNVSADKAGKCAKCGMELKKTEVPACVCKKAEHKGGCCKK